MGRIFLPEQDRLTIQEWGRDKIGVLESVDAHRLDQDNGLCAVFCGDGDQSDHLIQELIDIQKTCRPWPRIHKHSQNGGVFRLSPNFKKHDHECALEVFSFDIAETLGEVKTDIVTLALIGHWPCGKARKHRLSLIDTMAHYVATKLYLIEYLAEACGRKIKVSLFLHLDLATRPEDHESKCLRYVNRLKFQEWCHTYGHG